mgnify:CR=1 FL=1
MKLLIITQKVDKYDFVLGFFHRWIEEFAKHVEKVIVICLEEGRYALPENVEVYSLGKEKGDGKLQYLIRFYSIIISRKDDYDNVFVHMNQMYIILGGLFWKLWNKKIALWYVHRQISLTLRLAEPLVDYIFTSSKESFNIPSTKTYYVGHGVDSQNFVCSIDNKNSYQTSILYVGRITPIKNLETLVDTVALLHKKDPKLLVECVGEAVTESDLRYFKQLKLSVQEKHLEEVIRFSGSVNNMEIAKKYCNSTLSVNLSPTGGWDKSVLESIIARCPVFFSNKALVPVFGEYADMFCYEHGNTQDLADKITLFLDRRDRDVILRTLSNDVIRKYDLSVLVRTIYCQLHDGRNKK